jgi:SPP1 family predicted phage head-tail adaptor
VIRDLPTIGGLRERVQLQRKNSTVEAAGGIATVFVPVASLWARVTAVGARPVTFADGRSMTMTHTVVIRFRTGVGPGDRFVYRGRALEVLSAEDISGRRAFLACRCAEAAVMGAGA